MGRVIRHQALVFFGKVDSEDIAIAIADDCVYNL